MKKFSCFLLVLFFGLILVGCHKHDYKEEVTAPTCTEKGFTTYTCECGESYTDNEVAATGHTYGEWVVVKEATETEKGLKERKCVNCDVKESEETPLKEHEHSYTEKVVAPTCTEKGYTEKTCACGEVVKENEVAALGHTEEVIAGKEATCTEKGLTEGKKCSVCGVVTVEQTEIAALGHTEEVLPGKAATCTEKGLTEGKHCSVCNEVLVAQTEIAALGHTEVVDAAKAATCTEKGLTEGKHCSVCNEVLVAQTEIAALGHTEEVVPGKAATCTEAGLTEGKKCSVCGVVTVEQTEIPAAHTEEVVPGKAATCTEAGLTDGKKCSVCGVVTVEQTEIAALGHTEEVVPGKEATCAEPGLTEGKKCSVCGIVLVEQEEIKAAHTEVIYLGREATCTTKGKTDKVVCKVCNEVLVESEELPALGHSYGEWTTKTPATPLEEGVAERECATCGDIETKAIPALSEQYSIFVGNEGFEDLATAIDYALEKEASVGIVGEVEFAGVEGTSQNTDMKGVLIEGLKDAVLVFVNAEGSNVTGTGSFINANLKDLAVVDETFYTGENGENAWEFTYLEFSAICNFENVEFTDGILIDTVESVATFTNCTFVGHPNDSSEYGNVTMYGAWIYSGEATFKKCEFTGTRGLKVADQYGDSDVKKVVVDGCTFGPLSEKPGIAVDNRKGSLELVIKNSTFVGTQAGDQGNYMYEDDNRTPDVTTITLENNTILVSNLEELKAAFANGVNVKLMADIEVEIPVTNGKAGNFLTIKKGATVKLDLNGHNITAKTAEITANGNTNLIINHGTFELNGEGKISLQHIGTNMGWNALSAVITNCGTAVINGGEIVHLGGTDMNYAIDNNSNGVVAELEINDGYITSTYRPIRMFVNGKNNTVTINGGTVEAGNNCALWLQHSNASYSENEIATINLNGGVLKAGMNGIYVWGPDRYYSEYSEINRVNTVIVFGEGYRSIKWASYAPVYEITLNTNGGGELESLEVEEGKTAVLPTPVKANHNFKGWFLDEELNQAYDATTPVTSNFILYAKWEKKAELVDVEVKLDPNGANWPLETQLANATAKHTITINNYLTTNWGDYVLLKQSAQANWWNIVLVKTEYEGIYKIVEVTDMAYASSLKTASFDYVVAFHLEKIIDANALADFTTISKDAGSYVGKYASLANIPAAAVTGSAGITFKVLDTNVQVISAKYKNATTLPTLTKYLATFKGWKSSIDGEIYTEFSGYYENPGVITYTAVFENDYDALISVDKYNTQRAAGGIDVYLGVNLLPKGFSYLSSTACHRIVLKSTATVGKYEVVAVVVDGVTNTNGYPAEYDYVICVWSGDTARYKAVLVANAEVGDTIVFENDPSTYATGYVGVNAYLIKTEVQQTPIELDVTIDRDNGFVNGSYITNNSSYPDPSYYGSKGYGLKMSFVNMGVLSNTFEAQSKVSVTLDVNALNSKSSGSNADAAAFTVYGLDASGEVVATGTIDTLTEAADGYTASVVIEGTGITQVKVIMTDFYFDGTTLYNVNFGGFKVKTVE